MIYTYHCRNCNGTIDREAPMGEQPATIQCPICQGDARRVFTCAAVHYRGTGWTGAGHGVPDMDERKKLPGPLQFDDLLPEDK